MNFFAKKITEIDSIQFSILTIVVFSKLITWIAFPVATLHPDSTGYSTGNAWNFSLVSFLGHSGRNWPVPLFYSLFPNDSLRILAQLVISAAVWSYLIISLRSLVLSRKVNFFVAISVAIIAISPQVTQWDTTILGTSLMVSTCTLILALIVRISSSDKNNKIYTRIVIALCLFLFIQKSSNAFLAFGLILLVLIQQSIHRNLREFSWILIMIIGLSSWGAVVGKNVNNHWEQTYSGTTLLWQLGGQSPSASDFKEFLRKKNNVPSCLYQDAPFADINLSIARIFNECEGAKQYVKRDYMKDFIEFAVSNPKASIKLVSIAFGASYTNSSSNYGSSVSLIPQSASSIFFGDASPGFSSGAVENQESAYLLLAKGEPQWLSTPAIGFLLLAIILNILVLLRGREKRFAILHFSTMLCFLIQIVVTAIFIPSEWVRQITPYSVPLIGLSLISIAAFSRELSVNSNSSET